MPSTLLVAQVRGGGGWGGVEEMDKDLYPYTAVILVESQTYTIYF